MSANNHYDLIIRQAVEDPDFRERLTKDPAGVWEEVTGVSIPNDVELIVVQNTNRTVHIVLPDSRLTLQELDDAGGSGAWSLHDSFVTMNPDMTFRCSGGAW